MPGRLEYCFWLTQIEFDPGTRLFSVPFDGQVATDEMVSRYASGYAWAGYVEQDLSLRLDGVRTPYPGALRIRCLLPGLASDTRRPITLHVDADMCPYVVEIRIKGTDQTCAYFPIPDLTGKNERVVFAMSTIGFDTASANWPLTAELLEKHRNQSWLFSA